MTEYKVNTFYKVKFLHLYRILYLHDQPNLTLCEICWWGDNEVVNTDCLCQLTNENDVINTLENCENPEIITIDHVKQLLGKETFMRICNFHEILTVSEQIDILINKLEKTL